MDAAFSLAYLMSDILEHADDAAETVVNQDVPVGSDTFFLRSKHKWWQANIHIL